jgi:hypothetical protein
VRVEHQNRWQRICAALTLSLLALATPTLMLGRADASSPGFGALPVTAQIITSIAAVYRPPNGESGFWVQLQDISPAFGQPRLDGTYAIGAPQYADVARPGNIVAVGTQGYMIVTAYGEIIARGPGVPTLCGGRLSNCSGYPSNPPYSQPIVGVAATPSGQGLLALDRHGKVWTAGDAVSYGDAQRQGIPTGIAMTPSGKGYYIVESSGGVHSFGDAVFYGSTGGNRSYDRNWVMAM